MKKKSEPVQYCTVSHNTYTPYVGTNLKVRVSNVFVIINFFALKNCEAACKVCTI